MWCRHSPEGRSFVNAVIDPAIVCSLLTAQSSLLRLLQWLRSVLTVLRTRPHIRSVSLAKNRKFLVSRLKSRHQTQCSTRYSQITDLYFGHVLLCRMTMNRYGIWLCRTVRRQEMLPRLQEQLQCRETWVMSVRWSRWSLSKVREVGEPLKWSDEWFTNLSTLATRVVFKL